MAFSAIEGKAFFREFVRIFQVDNQFARILDIGAGAGTYHDQIVEALEGTKYPRPVVHGVEFFFPYLERFRLADKYDRIMVGDATEMRFEKYDLIILGDVLEHIPREKAIEFFKYLKTRARFVLLSLPVDSSFRPWFWGYPQPESDWAENVAERHQHEWQYDEVVKELGPFLWQIPYRTVAVFVAEGNGAENE